MNTETKTHTRRASHTGILMFTLLWLASCAPEQDAANANDQAEPSAAGSTAKVSARRPKEGGGQSLGESGALDEERSAADSHPAHPAGEVAAPDPSGGPAFDGERATQGTEVGHCTTSDVVGEPAPLVADVPVLQREPEGLPAQIPTSDEVREHLAMPAMPVPSAATLEAQAQYLQEAEAIKQAMNDAAPGQLDARLVQRKAELLE